MGSAARSTGAKLPTKRPGRGCRLATSRAAAVLFDVGNTLAHIDYVFVAACLRAHGCRATPDVVGRADALVRRHGWSAAPGASAATPRPPRDGFFATYIGALCDRLGLDEAAGQAVAAEVARAHRSRPLGLWDQVDPDAARVLQTLTAAGLRLGVVSNADGRVEGQLLRLGLRPYFQVVIDSAHAGVAKPDPRIFTLALQALGTAADQTTYVGDIVAVDVHGAEGAGLHGLLYDRWNVWPDASVPRIIHLHELPAWVLG